MPQALLPLICDDASRISDLISVARRDGQWFYFCGTQPVFQHQEGDLRSFRMFTAQLCVQGACKQADIIRAFGVSKSSVLRSVKKYRQEGVQGFYKRRQTRGAPVMTPPHERLPADIPEWFIEKDTDGDGQVMMSEFATTWNDERVAEFNKCDLNRDGIITPQECLAAEARR